MEITNNERNQRFEVLAGDYLAELVYRIRAGKMYLMHTWVPPELEGQGIASALAEFALNYAKDHGQEVVVYCPFVKAYIQKHPEWQ
ncbi:MAG: GNAT family N-acetyltransferase [Bacteroidota bacterium]